jgi:hypothetical protein
MPELVCVQLPSRKMLSACACEHIYSVGKQSEPKNIWLISPEIKFPKIYDSCALG